MITNDQQLRQAVEQLGRMYRALSALKNDVFPVSEQWFALMAEGPLEEIRQLQAAIDAYTGKGNPLETAKEALDRWVQGIGNHGSRGTNGRKD